MNNYGSPSALNALNAQAVMQEKQPRNWSTQECETVEDRPASEFSTDLYNLLEQQERAIKQAEQICARLFGPEPKDGNDAKELRMDHVAAQISRARRQAQILAERLQNIKNAL